MINYRKIIGRIGFIYNFLGSLKISFWICVFFFALQSLWEVVVVFSLSNLLDGIVSKDAASVNNFFGHVVAQYSVEQRPLMNFTFAGVTLFIKNLINNSISAYQTGFSTRYITNSRVEVFRSLSNCSMSFFDNHQKGALMQMVINETRSCYNILKCTLHSINDFLMVVVYMGIMLYVSADLTLVILAIAAVYFLLNFLFAKIIKRFAEGYTHEYRYLTIVTDDGITGAKQMKLLGRYDRLLDLFGKASWRADNASRKSGLIVESHTSVSSLFTIFSFLGLLYLNQNRNLVTFATLLGFFYTVKSMFTAMSDLNQRIGLMNVNFPAVDNIMSFLKSANEQKESSGEIIREHLFEDKIVFQNVGLNYASVEALKCINFEIKKGMKIALIGESGSGKTSLVNLLPRLYSPTSGTILLDNEPIENFNLSFLRSKIAVVNQDNLLFNCSVKENILMARPEATDEEVIQAAQSAFAHEFITELPEGYDTIIGDRGSKLSGGQRQRVCIAQAFLKKSEIVIFDEATSALDSKSEYYVQQSIDELEKMATCVMIAHRLSTVKKADLIVLMKDGLISEVGSWDELLKKSTNFNDMLNFQSLQ